ncbi:hypothetical protein L6R52_16655, partial [Myxococcota bacterium]|nr:hypothetical protein [Myxococcota bacterium]
RAEGSAPAVGHAPRADAAAHDGADLALFALARRTQQLERVLANLDAQRTLLRELVARAAGTNHALTGVATALDRELAECKAWVAATERDSAAQVIAYALGLAGFVAEVASMPAAAAAVSIARVLSSALLDDVDGARTEAEALVWRTVARLATAGLVDAGVGEGLARTLVASVRGVATTALDGERREARALADAAIRAGLGEAQRSVVSFLVAEASDALPLVSLVRSVLAMPTLTRQDAATLIDHLRAPGRAAVASPSGLDAALATLRAATE